MAKQPSQSEGIRGKLKSILGLNKGGSIITVGHEEREVEELLLTNDILKDVGKESTTIHRCKVLRDLTEKVAQKKLEEHAIEALWQAIQDLLLPTTPAEARQTALRFLIALAAGQFHKLGMLRAQFFRLIVAHKVKEDLPHRIDLLQVLTDNGKDIAYCEQIGSFLISFLPDAIKGDRAEDILLFLVNLVHFNSSFLDSETTTGLVNLSCKYCGQAQNENEIKILLELLDAVVSYSGLPAGALQSLISTLCRTVNIEALCQSSWKLMKKLAGTRLGHSTIYIMCCMLEDDAYVFDISLLRGAVFFIGMCVWGSKRVPTLRHKPISLLPSIKRGLRCNHPIVGYEAGLSLQRLVKKYGKELDVVTWDLVMDITECLLKLLEGGSVSKVSLQENVHDLITSMEELYSSGRFVGSAERFFHIIEKCATDRPESSVIRLLEFIGEKIHPVKEHWLEIFQNAMEKYFCNEKRSKVRVKVLDLLSSVMALHRYWYEDEIIDKIVIPYLSPMYNEVDKNVRLVAAQLLVDLVGSCNSVKCLEILSLIEKLVDRYYEKEVKEVSPKSQDEDYFEDIEVAVKGLVEAFKLKLFDQPIKNAVKMYDILVSHVVGHYVYGIVGQAATRTRLLIFKFLLGLRADSFHRLGVMDLDSTEKNVKHSVYVSCKASDIPGDDYQSVATNVGTGQWNSPYMVECPYYKAFDAILNGLKDEWDWGVFEVLLKHLPQQLQSKALVVGGKGDVNTLCALLCKMVNDRLYLNRMRNMPTNVGRPEFLGMVFPILSVLATYCAFLERNKQYDLIMSMELGLNSQCGKTCVLCLTVCILEMRLAMVRVLPSILVRLSQISATIPMSIPVLEFLSCLKEIPTLYSNFVEEQYMSIFAIALPYTDAYKYTKYTVSLAHHVITSWFTRCPLSFRRGFVKLITKGLKSSAILPNQVYAKAKEDHTRSQENVDEVREFHEEMTHVCLDMMARYTFSSSATQTRRSPVVEFLLSNGVSQTWLLGNMLVTVTTNGKANKFCPVCTDFGRKKEAAKRAAAKVRKLLALSGDTKNDAENTTLSRSRTVSSMRPLEADLPVQRSRTVAESSPSTSKHGSSPLYVSPDQALGAKKPSQTESPGLLEKKGKKFETISKGQDSEDKSSVTSSSMPEALKKVAHGRITSCEVAKPESLPGKVDARSPPLALVDKLFLSPDGSYGSLFSPSRELLFSRQSSQTDVCTVVDSEAPSLIDAEGKGIQSSENPVEITGDPVAAKGQDAASKLPLVCTTSSLKEATLTVCETLANDNGKIQESQALLPSVSLPREEVKESKDINSVPLFGEDETGEKTCDLIRASKVNKVETDYDIIDISAANEDHDSNTNDDSHRPSLSETMCNCACDGWAEIMIRRPCGNTAWITKVTNRRIPEWNSDILADMAGVAVSLGYEDKVSLGDHSLDTPSFEKDAKYFTPDTEEVNKNGRNTRSSSNSTRQSDQDITPSTPTRHRRFSTGSIDIPGAFKFNLPSPDAHITPNKDDELGSSLQSRSYFDKPSVGQSPMALFHSNVDWTNHEPPKLELSLAEEEAVSARKEEGSIPRGDEKDVGKKTAVGFESSPKSVLRKTISSPNAVPVRDPEESYSPQKRESTISFSSSQNKTAQNQETHISAMEGSTLTLQQKEQTLLDISPRPRGKTVAAVPLWRPQSRVYDPAEDELWQGTLNPHFLFLQLFYSPFISGNPMYRPLLLASGEVIDRAVKILDGIPCFDTHKIGVLYVGPGQQCNEKAILQNVYGSARYADFVSGLGDLVKLSQCSTTETYTGGLDRHGNDGKCAYSWKDSSSQVIFHVATMMPNKSSDPACHSKKLHIGNNFVNIVYNDSDSEYKFGTIKGQFNFGEILIRPMDYQSNIVTVRVKEELHYLAVNTGPHVVSDGNLALLVRQLAIHTNMMTVIHQKDKRPGLAYGSNWLERLKQIKRMRSKVTSEARSQPPGMALKGNMSTPKPSEQIYTDFTDYT